MGASLRNHHYYSDVRDTNNSQQLSSKASCSAPPFPHSLRKMTKDTEQKMWEREHGLITFRFFFFSVPLPPCRPALSMEKYIIHHNFFAFVWTYLQPNRGDFEKNVCQPQFDLYEPISIQIFLDCRGFVCICVQESNNMCPRLSPLPISPNTPS